MLFANICAVYLIKNFVLFLEKSNMKYNYLHLILTVCGTM